jgi:hypothetical protein
MRTTTAVKELLGNFPPHFKKPAARGSEADQRARLRLKQVLLTGKLAFRAYSLAANVTGLFVADTAPLDQTV